MGVLYIYILNDGGNLATAARPDRAVRYITARMRKTEGSKRSGA